jgi:hypothetical protein
MCKSHHRRPALKYNQQSCQTQNYSCARAVAVLLLSHLNNNNNISGAVDKRKEQLLTLAKLARTLFWSLLQGLSKASCIKLCRVLESRVVGEAMASSLGTTAPNQVRTPPLGRDHRRGIDHQGVVIVVWHVNVGNGLARAAYPSAEMPR